MKKNNSTMMWSIIVSIFLSEIILYLIAYLTGVSIEDFGGYLYVRIGVPVVTSLFVIVLTVLIPKTINNRKKIVMILSAVLMLSLPLHYIALSSGNIGGYKRPAQLNFKDMSLDELAELLPNRNDEITYAVFEELDERGPSSSKVLVRIIDKLKKTQPASYFDFYETKKAVEILARRADTRAIPVLNDMLTSKRYIIVSHGNVKEKLFTARSDAKELLNKYFNIKVNTKTKEPVKNS